MSTETANKRVTLIVPRKGMTLADFHAHWSGPHGAIARDLPGLVWYVQNHVIGVLWRTPGYLGDVQGIAEVAFHDPAALRTTIESWVRLDELREDENRFVGERIGNWAILRDDPPAVAQRRIIVALGRPDGATDPISSEKIAAAVDAIRAVVPCHAEEIANDPPAPGAVPGPDWFLFAELPSARTVDDLLSPDGPVLRHLKDIDASVAAYLVYAEAKRLPVDLLKGGT